ncbi:hypothetical protein [Acidovorax sp. CF316]|uniref:hypothetical protein n=1 Tax=Acidovorax sp. CF316 TaxID=1144317 RepID=UPI0011B2912D|nr:hypothetical protein [Acidovorax sp. CF316]
MAWFPRWINGKQGTRQAAESEEEAARRHVALEGNNGNGPQATQALNRHAHRTQAATGFKSNDPPAGPRNADWLD